MGLILEASKERYQASVIVSSDSTTISRTIPACWGCHYKAIKGEEISKPGPAKCFGMSRESNSALIHLRDTGPSEFVKKAPCNIESIKQQ